MEGQQCTRVLGLVLHEAVRGVSYSSSPPSLCQLVPIEQVNPLKRCKETYTSTHIRLSKIIVNTRSWLISILIFKLPKVITYPIYPYRIDISICLSRLQTRLPSPFQFVRALNLPLARRAIRAIKSANYHAITFIAVCVSSHASTPV